MTRFTDGLIVLIAGIALMADASPTDQSMDTTTRIKLEMEGRRLSAAEASDLESKISANPEDLSSRVKLLVYELVKQRSPGTREKRQENILWMIEHHPDIGMDGPYLSLNSILDGAVYGQAKALWLSQVKSHPNNAVVMGNAANFCLLSDRTTAEELFKKAQSIEPQNSQWPEKLGHLYVLSGEPAKALQEFEKVQPLDFSLLDDLALTAFNADDMAKARKYATELLQEAAQNTTDWNYGNAILHGNMVLGRIALREGKMEESKKYLLDSGKTPGSPQLGSFGPNMSLAKDLLEKGEKQTVLEYFKECAVFWKMGSETLATWTAAVKEGKTPDFGANLTY